MLVIYFKDYDDTNIRVIKNLFFLSLENMPLVGQKFVPRTTQAQTSV